MKQGREDGGECGDLEALRKTLKQKDEEIKRKDTDSVQNREGQKLISSERDEIKKVRLPPPAGPSQPVITRAT